MIGKSEKYLMRKIRIFMSQKFYRLKILTMTEHEKFECQLDDLFLTKDNILKYYNSCYKELHKNKADAIEHKILESEERDDIISIEIEIETLINFYYQKQAKRMFYDTPPECWVESKLYKHRMILINKVLSELKSRIKSENKASQDKFIQVINAITGLAGVAVAIIAITIQF